MSYAELGIAAGGVLSLVLGVFHLAFYRVFNWAEEFKKIGGLNRAVFYSVNLFLAFLFLFFAYVSFAHQRELAFAGGLARTFIIFLASFWLFRAAWQVVYFKKPKSGLAPKMKVMRFVMIAWFLALSASYAAPLVFPAV